MQIPFTALQRTVPSAWIKKNLSQDALYWEPPERDGIGGYTWKSPVKIEARWEYERRIVYSSNGAEILSDISVWIAYSLKVGGYMFEGNYTAFGLISNQGSSPKELSVDENIQEEALQIVAIDKMYSLATKNITYYKATLQKYGISKRG